MNLVGSNVNLSRTRERCAMHDGHEIAEYVSYALSDEKQRTADRVKARCR